MWGARRLRGVPKWGEGMHWPSLDKAREEAPAAQSIASDGQAIKQGLSRVAIREVDNTNREVRT